MYYRRSHDDDGPFISRAHLLDITFPHNPRKCNSPKVSLVYVLLIQSSYYTTISLERHRHTILEKATCMSGLIQTLLVESSCVDQ